MAKVDTLMIEKFLIPVELMMENAGLNLARLALESIEGEDPKKTVQVIAGPGNNGGGGMVAARRLLSWGIQTEVYLPRGIESLKQIPHKQMVRYQKFGGTMKTGLPKSSENSVLLDCYIGYSYVKREDEISEEVFEFIRHSSKVISLDVPSGLNVTSGENDSKITPISTLTIAFVKTGILRSPSVNIGKLYICDIGVSTKVCRSELGIQWSFPFDITYLNDFEIAFRGRSPLEVIISKEDDFRLLSLKIKNT